MLPCPDATANTTLLAAQRHEELTAGKCQRGQRADGEGLRFVMSQASNHAHGHVPPRADDDGRLLPDRWGPLELVTLPSTHAGIRMCDELESYKIGQWARERARAGFPSCVSVKKWEAD